MQRGQSTLGSRKILLTTTVAATTETFVDPVAAELQARGHSIHLVVGDRLPNTAFPSTATVIPMTRGISPGKDAVSVSRWVKLIRRQQPDLVVAGTPKASLVALIAARLAGVPSRVYVIHGAVWDVAKGNRRRVLEAAERVAIASSTHQVAVSDSLARLVLARGLAERMPDVIGSGSFSGVDIRRFTPGAKGTPHRPTLCFVGRLSRDKGIDVLLRTLERVRERLDAVLVVVGGIDATSPPDPTTLASLAQNPHVEWVGEVPDVVEHLRRADVLLLPTAREGLPQVALEAQSCGIPVVSWRVTGVVDAVQDGFTGILVRYGDEVALADMATQLLADTELRARMSNDARAWVVSRFEKSIVVAHTVNYLEASLQQRIGGRL